MRYTCTVNHATFTIDAILTGPPADTVDDPTLAAQGPPQGRNMNEACTA